MSEEWKDFEHGKYRLVGKMVEFQLEPKPFEGKQVIVDGGTYEPSKKESDWISDKNTSTQWVSVEDRLPEDGEKVLVFGKCRCSKVKPYTNTAYYYDASNKPYWDMGCYKQDEVITHWMPLPEPPKESE